MKVIISERQLRVIIESENKRKLFKVPVDFLINNTIPILNNYKKKGFDGIVVDGDLYTIDLENDYVNDVLNNLVKVYGSLDIGGIIKPSSFDKLEEVTDWLYMIFNKDIKSLGSLKKVGGSLVLKGCNNLESFGDLEEVGDDLNISMTKLVKFSDEEIREKIKVGGKIKRGLLENNKNQYKLLLENYLEILKNNSLLDSTGIEGRFLNKRQVKELENEIVSNYSDELKFGKEDNDIRRNIFNIDNPLAEKTINGITLKIVEGLIKNKRKTYLLYADNQLIGEFYSVKDIKNIVNFLESKLIKNLK
jgi:hypothetical protein